jgi:hypothetical protein
MPLQELESFEAQNEVGARRDAGRSGYLLRENPWLQLQLQAKAAMA